MNELPVILIPITTDLFTAFETVIPVSPCPHKTMQGHSVSPIHIDWLLMNLYCLEQYPLSWFFGGVPSEADA